MNVCVHPLDKKVKLLQGFFVELFLKDRQAQMQRPNHECAAEHRHDRKDHDELFGQGPHRQQAQHAHGQEQHDLEPQRPAQQGADQRRQRPRGEPDRRQPHGDRLPQVVKQAKLQQPFQIDLRKFLLQKPGRKAKPPGMFRHTLPPPGGGPGVARRTFQLLCSVQKFQEPFFLFPVFFHHLLPFQDLHEEPAVPGPVELAEIHILPDA